MTPLKWGTVLGLLSFFVVSCATQYQLPPGQPTAKVRFITTTPGIKRVLVFGDDKCTKGLAGNGQIAIVGGMGGYQPEVSKLNMYDPPKPTTRLKEREVRADKSLTISFTTDGAEAGGNYGLVPTLAYDQLGKCAVAVSFVPKQGHQYEVTPLRKWQGV